jgi:hypothetical protein
MLKMFRTYAKQTLALLLCLADLFVLSAASRLANAILRKSQCYSAYMMHTLCTHDADSKHKQSSPPQRKVRISVGLLELQKKSNIIEKHIDKTDAYSISGAFSLIHLKGST